MAQMPRLLRTIGWVSNHTPGASFHEMSPRIIRRLQRQWVPQNKATALVFGALADGVTQRDVDIAGPGGALTVRIYAPEDAAEALPLIVNLHPGGWTVGALANSDWLCSHVSRRTEAIVVSVDYRLAPQHPFPAAIDDALAGLLWAAEHAAELGADATRIGVMGDSAGGNLAAVLALIARDGDAPAISHQSLIYPCIDASTEHPSKERNAHSPILTSADMRAFTDNYCPAGVDRSDWRVSPLLAPSHAGVAPALVQVAEHDPLHDEGVAYAEALVGAGVAVRLTDYVGWPHGFMTFPGLMSVAEQALAEVIAEQRKALH